MRYGVWVVVSLGACSSSHGVAADAKPVDVAPPPDADLCADVQVPDCVYDGLAGLPFDGTTAWTLTGSEGNAGQMMPFTRTLYFLRQGCTLQQATAPITSPAGAGYVITDTHAGYYETGEYPHPYTDSLGICVSAADGALHYAESQMRTMPMVDYKATGILTH